MRTTWTVAVAAVVVAVVTTTGPAVGQPAPELREDVSRPVPMPLVEPLGPPPVPLLRVRPALPGPVPMPHADTDGEPSLVVPRLPELPPRP